MNNNLWDYCPWCEWLLDQCRCVIIAKPNTWYDEGTQVKLIAPYGEGCDAGLFVGIRDGKADEEGCGYDEFDIGVSTVYTGSVNYLEEKWSTVKITTEVDSQITPSVERQDINHE